MSEQEQTGSSGNQYEQIIRSLPGRILPKRYRIDKLLSVNSYSALYRTYYEPEEQTVALRVFKVMIRGEEDYQYKRFKQDYKHLQSLRHPNIGRLLDVGIVEEGLPYIILENLVGPTLEEILVSQNRLDPDQVVLIFSQIARAVNAAHQQGIAHETLHPGKIIISETETGDAIVRTTGFGHLSLLKKAGLPLNTPLSVSQIIGTPAYMSPEQCYEGAAVDGRSDIYSIGCMIYECLSGQVPFLADVESVMKMHLGNDPTPLSVVRKDLVIPRKLLAAMNHCLVKDPTSRYQFARDLQIDLEQDLDPSQRDEKVNIPESLQKAELRVKESKAIPLKLLGTILAAIVGIGAIIWVGSYIASMTSKLADNGIWQAKLNAGKQALVEGKVIDAGTELEGALSESSKFPPPDLRQALSQTEVAAYYITTGRYGQALTALRQALDIEQRSNGDVNDSSARTLELLAEAELQSGKNKEAEEHARASVKFAEHVSGENTIRLYKSYLQHLKVLVANNKLDEARATLEKIKAAIGATNIVLPVEVISGKKQAEAILDQANKKYADAETKLLDVLGSRQEKMGLSSLASIETMTLLGKIYACENQYQKSTDIMQRALDAKEKMMGDESPAIAELAATIARIYGSAKHRVEAEKYYRLSLELAEKSWGKGKIETLPYIDAMAELLNSKGEKQKAEVYEVEALDIRHPERVSKLGAH